MIVNRMETNQHESNKKAVSPVRSIQHVSHQHTGDIGKSLQEEYFLYNRYKLKKGAKELLSELQGSDKIEEEQGGESFLVSGGLSPLLARVVEPGQAVGIGKHLGLVLN